MRLTTPARAAPEWANIGAPRSKLKTCATLTMLPVRRSIRCFMKRLQTFQVPFRLRSMTARQPLSLIANGCAWNWPPALLTT